MEFKLNKIDTDLRRKLNNEFKSNKIHGVKETFIIDKKLKDNKDKNKKKNLKANVKSFKEKLYMVTIEKSVDKTKDDVGVFLDTKK